MTIPDERHSAFVRIDAATQSHRPATLEEFHAAVDVLALGPAVPNDIAAQFDLARHAYFYSWYVYDLTILGNQQAYFTVEMALNRRASMEGAPTGLGMKRLLDWAITRGWISDGGFAVAQARQQLRAELPAFVAAASPANEKPYVDVLLKCLPPLRNALAHGEPYLLPPGHLLSTLEICRDLINQLFPEE